MIFQRQSALISALFRFYIGKSRWARITSGWTQKNYALKSMYKVFITRRIPEAGIKLLKQKKYEVKVSPLDRVLSQDETIKMGKGFDAIISLLTDTIDGKVMDGIGKQLKIIANYAVGYNNIDIKAARERGIVVTNTPGVLTEAVAEHTIALIFALAERIVESDEFVRQGKFRGWEPMLFLGTSIIGKTLGILGLGRIGTEVARRMHDGFDVEIIYYDVKRDKKMERKWGLKYVSFPTLLRKSDFLSVHVPLLPQTRHMIGMRELKMMKRTAFLINTSRGPVVDERALVIALKKDIIRGAALDVFEWEPKLAPGLVKLPDTVLTPHIASATEETRNKMAEMAAKNIIAALGGKTPQNLIR